MAVEACSTPNMMMDDMDDDEAPMVFKRSSSSRQYQSNAEKKKQSSQPSVQAGVRPANGESSRAEKSFKTPPIPKASNPSGKASPIPSHGKASPGTSHGKASPVTSHGRASPMTSSGRASPITSPGTSSRISSSSTSLGKQQNHPRPPTVKQAKPPVPAAKGNSDSEDSDDDEKPLSARHPTGSAKRDSNHDNKKGDGSSSVQKPPIHDSDDSEDEKPLSHRFSGKSSLGTSAAKVHQNGSGLSNRPVSKSLSLSNKRPSSEVKPTQQPLVKKPKLSSPTTSGSQKSASVKAEPKVEDDEDDDVPLSQRGKKSQNSSIKPPKDEDDHVPLSQRTKNPLSSGSKAKAPVKKLLSSSLHKTNKNSKKDFKNTSSKSSKMLPGSGDGQKWTTLEHNGVIFPAPYKPHGVKMLYKGKPVTLTPEQEEVATMFAVMLDTEYMNKPRFKENFFSDWKKLLGKTHTIQNLDDCDFTPIQQWHLEEKEKKKQMTTEEKKALKAEKDKLEEKYQWAFVDGVKEKVGNFRVEPPGLFRGRGEHPKMGKLKKRIRPSDIVINIGKDAPVPECPISGERWKEVRHDNTVIWLAYWVDPINQKEFKYVQLAASSSLKGQSDKQKYEKARLLKDHIHRIRDSYTRDFTSGDPTKKQIAVATYLIDKLALRAGNEKDDDEADTVGCCTLKVENVEIAPPSTLKFDFLGKDSIRYQNEVEVEPAVFTAIKQFRKGKKGSDDLFDKLDTSKLNAHLKQLMDGLTAKVFRTYNASITLDDMLSKETKGGDVAQKVVVYNSANKEVAIICNHQRTVSKTHSVQMARLDEKIDELKAVIEELKEDLSRAKKGKPPAKSADGKSKRNLAPEALEKKIAQTNVRIEKMERDKLTKEDLKTVALGTSKINYLDPRITVAWCKRHEVPIEKIFNKSLLAKFCWAMDVDPSFRF